MSDGRMNVRLETQREKVSGGVAETLDIIIADELGARPYELFSGGEGFRANLALRIALSKLLARRAGAQLQTLIIDEGFGSQDTRGLSLVVETINSIKDDFQLRRGHQSHRGIEGSVRRAHRRGQAPRPGRACDRVA